MYFRCKTSSEADHCVLVKGLTPPAGKSTIIKMGFSWPLNSSEQVIDANSIYTRFPLLVSQRGGTGYDFDWISYPLGLTYYSNPDEHYLKVVKAFDGNDHEVDAANLTVVASPSTDKGRVFLRNTGNTQIRVAYVYVEVQPIKLRFQTDHIVYSSPQSLYIFSLEDGFTSCFASYFPDITEGLDATIPLKTFKMDGTPVDAPTVKLYRRSYRTYLSLVSETDSPAIGYVEFNYPWSDPVIM